ncbi:HAD family phosphatase [Marinovum sp.]|uniref:HAD family hydrolase n=1 Tax=Marinovum sp. TaxID=2024839 RepID=UPI002B272272|nr:HAD family phosphatase [Marinovum sp.]
MIKAIAWDIDGTLVDSEPLHLFALKQVCLAHEVDISDLDDTHFVGVHIGNVWKELQPRFPAGLSFAAWSEKINRAFADNARRLVEIAGARAVVAGFAEKGLRQVAVSNSNRAVVDANLAAIGVAEFMEFSLSLDDVCEGKPDPFPYRLACYLLRLDPSEVLAVEDSATGAASARAAGLPVAFLHAKDRAEGQTPIASLAELTGVIAEQAGATGIDRDAHEELQGPQRLRHA